jgi:hypothetical protein
MSNYCVGCQDELMLHLDADPNGSMNAECARCRAEADHDFDKRPKVRFDRTGREIERRKPEPPERSHP